MALFYILGALIFLFVLGRSFAAYQVSLLRKRGLYPQRGAATMEDVKRFLRSGKKIMAIGCYREMNHCSIAEAKQAVEALATN